MSLFEIDLQIGRHAKWAAEKIFEKRADEINAEAGEEYQRVDTKSLEVSMPRSLGPEYVCHSMCRRLDFPTVLRRQGVSQQALPLLEALVIGRLIAPGSELWTRKWAEELSSIYALTGMPSHHSLQSYYRETDKLYECGEALEEHLNAR